MDNKPREVVQSLQGGSAVMIAGTDLPLWGMEIDPEKAKAEFRASAAAGNGKVSRCIK